MSVSIRHDEENNVYELGGEVDGVFIPFVTYPGETVAGRIDAAHAAADAAETATPPPGRVAGNEGDDFDPADFTGPDADGAYTRSSTGERGRFGPSGFEPIAAP